MLENRKTYVEWEKVLMGPIKDTMGVEQGGTNSSDQYKLYNNEQFSTAQQSNFGIDIGPVSISFVGQADDSVLLSSDIHQLGHLLQLTMAYCRKYKVEMSPEKTKLQVFSPPSLNSYTTYMKAINYLNINGIPLTFTNATEHVGIIRSPEAQNLPHILQRISSHKRSMGAVLSAGIARSHRVNPAACLRTEKLYGLPVFLSGLGSLYLQESDLKILAQHYKETLQGLQKLYQLTPEPVVFFLGGSLPFRALLHIRQIGLFCMIARMPGNILHSISHYVLTCLPDSTKSWFKQIENICFTYNLPHPLLLLKDPPDKDGFKGTVKLKITEFWQNKLRAGAAKLADSSLCYFKPEFMSLLKPHPIWTTCGANSYETNKGCIQAKYLSGRFRTDKLLSHFSSKNSLHCQLHPEQPVVGDLQHHLVLCPALQLLFDYWDSLTSSSEPCKNIIRKYKSASLRLFMQFILEFSVFPEIIEATQNYGGKS